MKRMLVTFRCDARRVFEQASDFVTAGLSNMVRLRFLGTYPIISGLFGVFRFREMILGLFIGLGLSFSCCLMAFHGSLFFLFPDVTEIGAKHSSEANVTRPMQRLAVRVTS